MKCLTKLLVVLATVWLSACSTTSSISNGGALDAGAKWVLLPLTNHTDTPQAALAAEAMVEHHLRLHGLSQLVRYPATLSRDTLFEPSERRVSEDARKWAREQGARYGVQGAVEEWRYKVGIDGEPAAGVTLQIIDLSNNDAVVWSASAARSGWSREALSAVATKVMENLVAGLPLSTSTQGAKP